MKFNLGATYWIFYKFFSKLTFYWLLILLVLLWILGCWIGIIPMYFEKISALKIANRNISQVSKVNPKIEYKSQENSRIINKLSYEDILSISKKHSLKLDEFRYNEKPLAKYEVIVKGSWLNVREFLYELTTTYQYTLFIESLDFQRDQLTNEVSLNILISIGENDEITSESSS